MYIIQPFQNTTNAQTRILCILFFPKLPTSPLLAIFLFFQINNKRLGIIFYDCSQPSFFCFNLLTCLIAVFFVFVMFCLSNYEILSLQLHESIVLNLGQVLFTVVCSFLKGMNDVGVATRLFCDICQLKYNLLCQINMSFTKSMLGQLLDSAQ